MNQKKDKTVPLGTQISKAHRDKLNRLKQVGLQINIVVEMGIDAVYEQMVKAKVVVVVNEVEHEPTTAG